MIWSYDSTRAEAESTRVLSTASNCVYCGGAVAPDVLMRRFRDVRDQNVSRSLRICTTCGWWTIVAEEWRDYCKVADQRWLAAASCLRNFDVCAGDQPIEEIRSYLTAKYDARFEIAPSLFEQVVASVYRAEGFHARVVGRTGDGGVDIVLDGPADKTIAIQVKRYRKKIKVEQIRAFTGALMLGDFTSGVFVTTSTFQSGASRAARAAAIRGFPIELVDGKRFYEALSLVQRAALPSSS